jgi:hypothetical protein
MSYLDDYRNRINTQGSTTGEGYSNASKNITNSLFENSPTYYVVPINNVDTGVRLINEDVSTKMTILFRPDTVASIGSIVYHNELNWLLTDFINNDRFPKGSLQLCNYTLSIDTPPTKSLKGYDGMGRPVYSEVPGTPLLFPCVIETTFKSEVGNDESIILPKGNIRLTMAYVDNPELKFNKQIFIHGDKYKIADIDYSNVINNVGTMRLNVEKV